MAELDGAALRADGRDTLLFDLDNTLGPWGVATLGADVLDALRALQRQGFSIGVLSNSRLRGRRAALAAQLDALGIPLLGAAGKPSARGYRRLLAQLGSEPRRAVVVGDQWLTDVLGAKRLRMPAVLVEPVDGASEPGWARLRRLLERHLLRWLGG